MRVELAVEPRVTEAGLRVQARPDPGATERLTVPENPLRLFTLIVTEPLPPANTVIALGTALRLKSLTWKVRLIE